MKKFLFLIMLGSFLQVEAQQNLNQLLAAGIDDAQKFTQAYLTPASEAAMSSITNGWYSTAKVKKPGRFEISVIGNASSVQSEHRHFRMNVADYENISFVDGSIVKDVATAFGQNDPEVQVYVEYDTPFGTQQETITLPNGFGETLINAVPSAFLQARVGIFKGTEIKGRFFPKIDVKEVEASFYGGALQHEFTSWIPGGDLFPLAVSGIVAYTHLDGSYDFTENSIVEGEDQVLKADLNTWMFAAIVSTKWKYVNFYGSLGYIKADTSADVLGTYSVQTGVLQNQTIEDPFGITSELNSVRANLGLNLEFSFFNLFTDYSYQKYHNLSVGIGFGI